MQYVVHLSRAQCLLLLFAYLVPSACSDIVHTFSRLAGGTTYAETRGNK